MIKLFVSDLDGTLLNQYHTSDRHIDQGIAEIKKRGYKFAIATGRHLRRHQQIGLKFLSMTDYLITMNGALVLDQAGQVLFQQAINGHKLEALISKFPQISFEFVTANAIYVMDSRGKHFQQGYQGVPKGQFRRKAWGRSILNALLGGFEYGVSLEKILESKILKVECITNREVDRQALIDYLEEEEASFSYAFNDHVHFEISAQGVNKREGLLQLLRKIEIHPDQVAVYGNDQNDLEMLAYFIHAYAPNSANPLALKEAREVVDSVKDHGVIKHMVATARQQDAYRS